MRTQKRTHNVQVHGTCAHNLLIVYIWRRMNACNLQMSWTPNKNSQAFKNPSSVQSKFGPNEYQMNTKWSIRGRDRERKREISFPFGPFMVIYEKCNIIIIYAQFVWVEFVKHHSKWLWISFFPFPNWLHSITADTAFTFASVFSALFICDKRQTTFFLISNCMIIRLGIALLYIHYLKPCLIDVHRWQYSWRI